MDTSSKNKNSIQELLEGISITEGTKDKVEVGFRLRNNYHYLLR